MILPSVDNSLFHCAVFFVFALQLLNPSARAQNYLDQSHETLGGWGTPASDGLFAQTFTVGRSGELFRVEVLLRPDQIIVDPNDTVSVALKLVRAPAGVPSLLAADFVQEALVTLPDAAFETLSSDIISHQNFQWAALQVPFLPVQAGDQFAIVAMQQNAIPDHFQWALSFNADANYDGGDAWLGTPSGPLTSFSNSSFGGIKEFLFRTYVVPEPASVVLLLSSLCAGPRFRRWQMPGCGSNREGAIGDTQLSEGAIGDTQLSE